MHYSWSITSRALKIVRASAPTALVAFNVLYWRDFPAGFGDWWNGQLVDDENIVMDLHLYDCYDEASGKTIEEHKEQARAWGEAIEKFKAHGHKILVGEWSLATGVHPGGQEGQMRSCKPFRLLEAGSSGRSRRKTSELRTMMVATPGHCAECYAAESTDLEMLRSSRAPSAIQALKALAFRRQPSQATHQHPFRTCQLQAHIRTRTGAEHSSLLCWVASRSIGHGAIPSSQEVSQDGC